MTPAQSGSERAPEPSSAGRPPWAIRCRRAMRLLLQLGVSAVFFAVLARQVDFDEALTLAGRADPGWILAALGFHLASQLLSSVRWQWAAWAFGLHVPFRRCLRLYFLGMLYNLFLPTGMGGDAVKAFLLSRSSRRTAPAVASILMERASGLLALMVLGAVALLVWRGEPLPWALRSLLLLAGTGSAAAMLTMPLLLRIGWVRRKLAGRGAGAARTGRQEGDAPEARLSAPWLLVVVQGAAFGVQILSIALLASASLAMAIPADLVLLTVGHALVMLVTLLPVSLAGLGLREASWAWLFGLRGLDPAAGAALGLLFFLVHVAGSLFGLIPLFRGSRLSGSGPIPPSGFREQEKDS